MSVKETTMARLVMMVALLVAALVGCAHPCAHGCPATPPEPHPIRWSAGNGRFLTAAGTSGTYTVPAGAYVTMISCTNTSGSSATVVITPSGTGVTSPLTGATITVPAGLGWTVARPVLLGNLGELGPATTIVFTGTTTYSVTLWQGV
jgi:hypothetical protein